MEAGKSAKIGKDEKKGNRDGLPLCLIVFRHENRAHTPVGLGHDPELDAVAGAIYRKKPGTFFNGLVVLLQVSFTHIAQFPA